MNAYLWTQTFKNVLPTFCLKPDLVNEIFHPFFYVWHPSTIVLNPIFRPPVCHRKLLSLTTLIIPKDFYIYRYSILISATCKPNTVFLFPLVAFSAPIKPLWNSIYVSTLQGPLQINHQNWKISNLEVVQILQQITSETQNCHQRDVYSTALHLSYDWKISDLVLGIERLRKQSANT